ncbi:hypothetical protein VB636_22325, partial [Paracoccus sp. APAP_BH8]
MAEPPPPPPPFTPSPPAAAPGPQSCPRHDPEAVSALVEANPHGSRTLFAEAFQDILVPVGRHGAADIGLGRAGRQGVRDRTGYQRHLHAYQSPGAVVVAAWDGDRMVGAA